MFVPTNDSFGRWLNIVTNTGATAATFNLIIANNLGSDNNTVIVTSSNGNATAETTDTWVTSFQNYSRHHVVRRAPRPRPPGAERRRTR